MKHLKYICLAALAIGFSSCNDEEDFIEKEEAQVERPALNSGSVDFSNYVAVGASFTSGYTDGALFKAGQEKSFPKLMSEKFTLIGGGTFSQPLMDDNTGGLLVGTTPVAAYRLVFNGEGPQRLNEFLTDNSLPVPPITTNAAVNLMSSFNNVGVPGLKSFHLTFPGYASANPYYARFASSGGATVLGDALNQGATFFTFSEIGGNDVLAYATSGGVGVDRTGDLNAAGYGFNDISDPTLFKSVIDGALNALTSGGTGAKGIVANVPYVSSLPYFTTVPHNPVPLDAATVTQLNSNYATYNNAVQSLVGVAPVNLTQEEADRRKIEFSAGASNSVVIIDEDLSDLTIYNPMLINMRQATASDLVVLPASSFIGSLANPSDPTTVNGVAIPLADQWILTPEEQLAIKNATDAYNMHIQDAVNTFGLALVDFKGILEQASTTGISSGEYILTTDLVTGGLVSLDGIHLTTRGYAVLANEMFKAIDATYGTNFEASGNIFDPADFNTNYSPTLQ